MHGFVKGVPGHVRSGRCARVDPPGARRRGSDAASRHLPTRSQTYHHHPDNTDVVGHLTILRKKIHLLSIDSRIEDGVGEEQNIYSTSAKTTELNTGVVD